MPNYDKLIGKEPAEVIRASKGSDIRLASDAADVRKVLRGTWKFKGKNTQGDSVWENGDNWEALARVDSKNGVHVSPSSLMLKEFSTV
jgi:hypothetical protein